MSKNGNELKHWYKAHGICQNCGQADVEFNHVLCTACRKKARESQEINDPGNIKHKQRQKAMREWKRAKGICVDCSNKAALGCIRCNKCLRKSREREQVKRIKNRIRKQAIKDGLYLGG